MSKKLIKTRLPTKQIILRTLLAGGIMSIALVAPNALTLVRHLDRGSVHRKDLYRRITQAITKLERNGFVKTSGTFGNRKVSLTKKGNSEIERIFANEYHIPEPLFWDGKWRMVMFDIREERKQVREQLRILLSGAGFLRIQDSVWVYPYPCDDFIALVRTHLRSGTGEMLSFVAEALEADRKLREHFKLM